MLFEIYSEDAGGRKYLLTRSSLPWGDAIDQVDYLSRKRPNQIFHIYRTSPVEKVGTWQNGQEIYSSSRHGSGR